MILLFVGAAFLFGGFLPGIETPLALFAIGVLLLAAGTLVVAIARRRRSV